MSLLQQVQTMESMAMAHEEIDGGIDVIAATSVDHGINGNGTCRI